MTATEPAPAARPQAPLAVVFTGLMLVMLLAALDGTIVATALPTIVQDLGGLEHISWVTSAYLLAQTVATPVYGKLGDLYGRKRVLQSAIVLFLVGSALCGLAQSMPQLIAFRAIQGLGAGGLIVLVQAVIGDIVSPRERGKYQGIFGAVFGLASVAGPLLGGLLVEHATWRWVFYVNLPVGLAALVVIALTLPAKQSTARPVIDYLGAGLLATGLTAIVLVTSLGGTTWEWASAETYLTAALGVSALLAFAVAERRAQEPIIPPELWRERVFTVAGALSMIVGFALFGAVTFLPLYFQTVDAASPTESGLRLAPMMIGVLVTSIASGQAITRIGRYKWFPVAGTACMAVALFMLGSIDLGTGSVTVALYLLLLGLGLGLTMQVLVLAVQNAVHFGVLGAATSGVTMLRGIGGSFGTAVFGAIFTNRLTDSLEGGSLPPALERITGGGGRLTGSQVEQLPRAARLAYEQAFVDALAPVFLAAAGVAALGFVVSLALEERPLRADAASHSGLDDSFAAPTSQDSLAEVERSLAVATTRAQRLRFHRGVAERAGVDLSPGAVWALVRIDEHGFERAGELAREQQVPDERIAAVVGELGERGLVSAENGEFAITPAGHAQTDQVVAARRELLAETIARYDPERRPEVEALLRRLARELVGERP
jgi:EmrB/QacA subfamily drug resistance transporter